MAIYRHIFKRSIRSRGTRPLSCCKRSTNCQRLLDVEGGGYPKDASPEALEGHLNDLYDYVTELKDALIKDGLHIMGKPPEGTRLEEMLYALTRLQNGSTPSLRAVVAEARKLDIQDLQDNPSEMHPQLGTLKGTLLDEVDADCHHLCLEGCWRSVSPE